MRDLVVAGAVLLFGSVAAVNAQSEPVELRAIDHMQLVQGIGDGCPAFRFNADAENTHTERAIRATFRWPSDDGDRTSVHTLEPGDIRTVTYWNFGDLKAVGARFVD